MKNLVLVLFALAAAFGCTPTPPPSADKSGEPAKEFKVALLTPGPVSDAGWSAMAYRGLQAIEKELGAKVNNEQAQDAQIKDAMRSYAQEGYSLVIGHGYEYNEPELEVAKDFPDTVFVSSSGAGFAKNAGAFRFAMEQGFYLAGQAAGLMTKSGKCAMIGGPDVPSIRSTFKAFKAGVLSVKPDAVVIESFTGSNDDVAKAKQATLAALGQGADMVIHQANAAAQGVFDACKEKGATAFGANLDQNDNPSGVVLASAVIMAEPAFVNLAKQVKEGTYVGEVTTMGMKEGAIGFIWNPSKSSSVPEGVSKKLEETASAIKGGTLQVPMDKF